MELNIKVPTSLGSIQYSYGDYSISNHEFRLISDSAFLQRHGAPGAVLASRLRYGKRVVYFGDLKLDGPISSQNGVWGPSVDTFVFLSVLRKYLENVPKIDNSMDIGCSTGALSLWLVREGWSNKCVGLDINTTAIDFAIANAKEANLTSQVTFVPKSFAQSPCSKLFDLLVMNPPYLPRQVHAEDFEDALNGCELMLQVFKSYRAFLRPGGRLLCSFSAISFMDNEIKAQVLDLQVKKLARCIYSKKVPFFIESVLADKAKIDALSSLEGIEVRDSRDFPYWHELQVWELR